MHKQRIIDDDVQIISRLRRFRVVELQLAQCLRDQFVCNYFHTSYRKETKLSVMVVVIMTRRDSILPSSR